MSPAAGITAERQADLSSGRDESRTLAEILTITHSALLTQVVPDAPEDLLEAAKHADSLGILARMQTMGEALYTHLGRSACLDLAGHPADTVRGWAVFALVSQEKDADVDTLLALARPAANDPHFGVREWSWMAVRPHLVPQLDEAIRALRPWTSEPSERIRRFASEALRPRGVWARHIPELKKEPERGLPLLEPLRADSSRYVQDSVANWVNDAAKTQPAWARELCERWQEESTTPATERIIKRALRSIR